MAEFKALSLREAALHDATMKYGIRGAEDLRRKLMLRKSLKRKGKKTNVGDPVHNKKR